MVVGSTPRYHTKITMAQDEHFYTIFYYTSLTLTPLGCVVIALILFGNVLVLISIIRTPKLQTYPNVFVANLAVADLMVGIIGLPMFLKNLFVTEGETSPHWVCALTLFGTVFPAALSAYAVFGITVDRYIFIVKPLHYTQYVTKKRVVIFLTGIWIYNLVMYAFPLLLKQSKDVSYLFCGLGNVYPIYVVYGIVIQMVCFGALIFILYIRVIIVAKKHSNQIDIQLKSLENNSIKNKKKSRMEGIRQAKMFFCVTAAMFISWMPTAVNFSVYILQGDTAVYHIMGNICVFTMYIFSFVNPLIYAARSADFRIAFQNTLRRHKTAVITSK